jgi:protein-S-isoprenylcysteine O-methyltransferase Ste14
VVPVPLLAVAIWLTTSLGWWTALGALLIFVGLGIRVWGVAHIGPASRTRGDDVHKLIYTGPYELSRNPLYVANLVLYLGVGLMTQEPRAAPVFPVLMWVHYSLIIRWEEWNLERRLGEVYRSYRNRVPRWLGSSAPVHAASPREHADIRWPRAWQSEKSTLLATAILMSAILLRGGLAGA